MQKIVLDTTFILPLFGIEISKPTGIRDHLPNMLNSKKLKYKFVIPNTCLLEVMYYLNREYRKTKDKEMLERYELIIPTLKNSDNVIFFNPLENEKTMKIGNELRFSGHADLLDCWIAASAIYLDAIFLSVDNKLKQLLQSLKEFRTTKVLSWSDYLKMVNNNSIDL